MTAAIPTRPKRDNLLGICAAIGADFGFDPFFLRIALAVGVIASAVAVLTGYAIAGVLVLLSRVLFRHRPARAYSADVHRIAPAPLSPVVPEALRQAA